MAHFLRANRLDRVDLTKFNCEGAEFRILTACPDAVLRRLERMLVLYHCELARGHSMGELLAKLQGAGYSTEICNQEATWGWIKATLA